MNDHSLAHELSRRLEIGLPSAASEALHTLEDICRRASISLYLVGGAVRDLLLEREGFDLDLCMEPDVGPVARQLAEATQGRVVLHDRFGTAKVTGRGFVIDLARTRRESYPHPGSLPVVEPSTIGEDLARRDFTINAVALRLTPEPVELLDPFRGVDDARSSLVRVLHERSFQDDATRMLRAVRYASRLDFKIARQTEALARRDLPYLQHISGPRLRRELALLFQEPNAAEGTLLAQRLGILDAIHPALRLSDASAERWRTALDGERLAPLDELGFGVVAAPSDEGTVASLSKWLHLAGRFERCLVDLVRLRVASPKLAMARPSMAVEILDGHAPSAVWSLAVIEGGDIARTCLNYLRDWRHVKPALDGNDLQAMGVPRGQVLGEVLRRLRAARVDGLLTSRDQEEEMAREAINDLSARARDE
ncbi:MAG TPA: hypothetical protein VFX19_11795 [Dehalococcoidia bacterium]|nr:hypothetical protein [Dehalococcoidia bacterium]